MLKRFLLLSPFLLSGCAAIATVGGGGVATIQTAQTIDMVSTGASAASTVTTGKSLTDHAISYIVGKDCRMLNVLNKKKFCRIRKIYEPNKGTSEDNNNYLISSYEENYQWETAQSVEKNIKSPVVGDPVNKLTKGKQNEFKLGTRHKRYAHKVRGKRSNLKIECKSSERISRVQDKISTRRTGRDEKCSKK
jgi:hypothetical protein